MIGYVSNKGLSAELIAEVKSKVKSCNYPDIIIFEGGMGLAGGSSLFENDRIAVITDSDIYNARDLASGYSVENHSNAALAASLYIKFGIQAFEKFRGSFAACIFDKAARTFILITDRFGIKPVVYSFDNGSLAFGSRINDIMLFSGSASEEIDYEALVDYINLSAIPTPRTIYKKIKKLPAGHFLLVDHDQTDCEIKKYYDIRYSVEKNDKNYFITKLPGLIKDSVRAAVDYKVMSGQNIGAFLSGGTDSSTIAGMIKSTAGHVKTFSIGFDEAGYNELDYARIAAKHYEAEHHEYIVSPDDVIKAIDIIVDAFDEPFGNASAIPTYYCARLAKENGVDSLLAGDGGDEVFGGNERYIANRKFNIYHNIPVAFRYGLIEPFLKIAPSFIPLVDKGKKYIRRANMPQPERFFSYNPVNALGMEHIFSRDLLASLNGYDNLQWAKELYNSAPTDEELNRLLYIDMKHAIADNDLQKVTTMSARAGINVDYPFLDHELVNFAATMPVSMKVKGTHLRYIFKESLKGFLPDDIIKKKKHGFGLPIGIWTRTDKRISSFVRDHLYSDSCSIRPYFRRGFIEEIFKLHSETESSYYGDIIYLLLVLELWHRKRVVHVSKID